MLLDIGRVMSCVVPMQCMMMPCSRSRHWSQAVNRILRFIGLAEFTPAEKARVFGAADGAVHHSASSHDTVWDAGRP